MKEVNLFDFKTPQAIQSPSTPTNLQTQLKLSDIMSLCYGLSETDLEVLKTLARAGETTVDYLIDKTGLSKAGINRSLNRLVQVGLVKRVKEAGNKVGRPRYLYRVKVAELKEKILEDIKNCFSKVSELIEKEFP